MGQGDLTVFVSYAHADDPLRKMLDNHLSLLKWQKLISVWNDWDISAGTDWDHEIDRHLNNAQIILLLISPDFMASKNCYGMEMKRAIERHQAGDACVIPILLRPVDWEKSPFSQLQVLPQNAVPVTDHTWHTLDEAFVDITKGIRKTVEKLFPLHLAQNKIDVEAASQKIALPLIGNIPHRRNPFFTGREEILTQLRNKLTDNKTIALTQPQAISGLGGIGKTQIALEYAYRYRDKYCFVLWARAANHDTLTADFIVLANLLRLPERSKSEQDLVIADVRHWLETHEEWLLILDNAEDLAAIYNFLPNRNIGHVLLTTRAQSTGDIAELLDVESMNLEEGTLFLLRRANLLARNMPLDHASKENLAYAEAIVTELGGLPLALDQAGAYIEETRDSLSKYLALYHSHRKHLLQRRSTLSSGHPEPVATTWSLSFQKIEQANQAAADLLRLCTFLEADAIPEEIITEGSPDLGPVLKPVADDPFRLNQAIEELRRFSLIRRNSNTRILSVHRLVQAVLKDGMNKRTQRLWAERAVRAVNRAFPYVDATTWLQCQRYLPHAQISAVLIEQHGIWFPGAARLLNQAALYYQDHARYADAETLYKQVLVISEQMVGPEHPDAAQCLSNLAELYYAQGKYKDAEAHHRRALMIRERLEGPEHPNTIQSLNKLVWLYLTQGNYAEAEPFLQRALSIREQVGEVESHDTAQSLNNLARLHYARGEYTEAEALLLRTRAIYEQIVGLVHPSTATCLNNLAELYYAQGKYEKAEPLYQLTLKVREQVVGPEHPDTAISLNNLALLYRAQGRYGDAEPLYLQALKVYESVLGSSHPFTATCLNNLAGLYFAQCKYMQAEPLYQRALAIREEVFGPKHSFTATILENYADLLRTMKREEEAVILETRVNIIRVT